MVTKKLTPAQKQYNSLKAQYKDCILFFRMGDFYEVFYEDAHICGKELEIAITSRNKNAENPIPMAGVPYHSAEKYISRLVKAGYKIAKAEQIGPVIPGQVVNRDVVEVITPGTYLEDREIKNYNYIAGVYFGSRYELCWGDFSLGQYWTKSFDSVEELSKFILKINPAELVIDINFPAKESIQNYIKNFANVFISIYDLPGDLDVFLKNIFQVQTLSSYGQALEDGRKSVVGLLFNYLKDTQKSDIKNINTISYWGDADKLNFDDISIKNLEITESSYEGSRKHSLIGVIDCVGTSMGSRLLRQVVTNPIKDLETIKYRSNSIKKYYEYDELRGSIISTLKNIGDIPRIATRIVYKKNSPFIVNRLKLIFRTLFGDLVDRNESSSNLIYKQIIELGFGEEFLQQILDYYFELEKTIRDEGFSENSDYIVDGYSTEIDELRKLAYHSDELLVQYQADVSQKLGFPVKIKYVNNGGYFIEITKRFEKDFAEFMATNEENLQDLDGEFAKYFNLVRRQTLKSAERYTTPYLSEVQNKILSSKSQLQQLEKQILEELKDKLESIAKQVFDFSECVAKLDLFTGFAQFAKDQKWTQPELVVDGKLEIVSGRHPVIEAYLPTGEHFIPNDLDMQSNGKKSDIVNLITGPNMGGKSTYLRQNAIVVLLSHCGLWAPADKVICPVMDGIYARVGSGDIIAKNQSTFMTEMIEVSNILHNATDKSFIVLDELGRGTSTYDGMALAKSILVYICEKIKAKTLFATHYHELIKLEGKVPGFNNYSVGVYETDQQVVFLKKIVKGGADKSYGIDVAKLAGLPKDILASAKDYLKTLESENGQPKIISKSLFDIPQPVTDEYKDKYEELKNSIADIDVNNLTPIEALNKLNELKRGI